MDINNICRHVMQVLEASNYHFEVTWDEATKRMQWKDTTVEFFFSEKDVKYFESEKTKDNRYLYYIIENLPKMERAVIEIHHIVSTLENQHDTVPYESSTRFPKAIAYCGARKKIVLNPIKLFDYIEFMKRQTEYSCEELFTFVFLHEYGHFLDDKEVTLSKRTKMFAENIKKEHKEDIVLLTEAQSFLYATEKVAWEKGKQFLSFFPYDLNLYDDFSLIALSSYKNPPFQYLKEKWSFLLAP